MPQRLRRLGSHKTRKHTQAPSTQELQAPRGPEVGSLRQHLQLGPSPLEHRSASGFAPLSSGVTVPSPSWPQAARLRSPRCLSLSLPTAALEGPAVGKPPPGAGSRVGGGESAPQRVPDGNRLRPMVRKAQAGLLTSLPAAFSPEGASKFHPTKRAGLL